ncbi:protein asteroid-like isoform X2 [Biomphalaria glabrata]|nr:protein asteroid-like isoform X2 [Biomphalaria glabrata]
MGIHKLTGFIDKNQHLLHEHQLHNSSVVIDGNNFYHFIYGACHVQCSFGGDYDIYRKSIITIFDSFKKCGVTPYVVMDGAYTRDGRKLKTSLSRAASRIQLVKAMIYNQRGHVLPALAYETFMQTLSELGIHHATCQFEADTEIAILANKLQCPVISNDSDFYIFDLSNGFLPLDYIDFRPLRTGESSQSYLHCHIYHVDEFIKSFEGLSRTMLPVFASLLGNDFIEPSAFNAFYAKFKVPKLVSKKFSVPPKLAKVISALHWLHTQVENNDISAIKSQILSFVNPLKKSKVERMFISSVNGYIDIDNFTGFDLFSYFTKGCVDWHKCQDPDFSYYNGAPFPDWFVQSVCKGEITPSVLNAAVLHRVIIPTQVENLKFSTSYSCSSYLRKVLYSIVMKDDPPKIDSTVTNEIVSCKEVSIVEVEKSINAQFDDGSEAHAENIAENKIKSEDNTSENVQSRHGDNEGEDVDVEEEESEDDETNEHIVIEEEGSETDILSPFRLKQVCVEEYNRVNRNLKKCYIEAAETICSMSVPGLSEIDSLSPDHRKSLLISTLQVELDFLNNFPPSMQLFMACVIYWVRNADPRIRASHIDSVLLGNIFLKVLCHLKENKCLCKAKQKCLSHDNKDNSTKAISDSKIIVDIDNTCLDCNIDSLKHVKQNLDKYHKKTPTFNRNNFFDPNIVHDFAQLQACMLDTINLNKVLHFPLPTMRPSEIINGTFLYNIFSDLQSRPKPDLFVTAMLNNNQQLCSLFHSLKTSVVNTVGFDCLEPESATKSKRKAKRQKCKNGMPKIVCSVKTSSHSSNSEEESNPVTVAGVDIHNRFNLLCLES